MASTRHGRLGQLVQFLVVGVYKRVNGPALNPSLNMADEIAQSKATQNNLKPVK